MNDSKFTTLLLGKKTPYGIFNIFRDSCGGNLTTGTREESLVALFFTRTNRTT